MKAQTQVQRLLVLGLFTLMVAILCFGCQHQAPKPEKENAFFEKWRAVADRSKGYSPTSKKKSLQIDEQGGAAAQPESPPKGADLPSTPLTLKMHNVEVGVLLRALAKAAGQNIIINESVEGRVNIDVEAEPWNQVFMSILQAQGLAYEKDHDILRIITLEDRNRSLQQLETEQKIKTKKREIELVEPLITRVVKIDYADAKLMKANLEQFLTEKQEGAKIGAVMVDEHTNSLIIQAMRDDLLEMIPIINELDRPTPQVLIEAHIVETDQETARQLGVRWGGLYQNPPNYYVSSPDNLGLAGVSGGANNPTPGLISNFAAPDVTGNLGLAVGLVAQDIGDSVLTLQLTALQDEGELNILSSPSVTTLDNQAAIIESGREVPYQTVENDEVKIEFKKAVLKLEVTPHVIEGKTLKLNINVNKDEVDTSSQTSALDPPPILTKKAATNIILYDGQTTVIGGLSKENIGRSEAGVPGLKDIPVLGWLFRNKSNDRTMEELLIFITPHILKQRPLESESALGSE
ncbi:MAG: type IV pilus secretin PilQ [Desulfobacterales bacterium]|jgi:type IV pilus assembly protein PilQ